MPTLRDFWVNMENFGREFLTIVNMIDKQMGVSERMRDINKNESNELATDAPAAQGFCETPSRIESKFRKS